MCGVNNNNINIINNGFHFNYQKITTITNLTNPCSSLENIIINSYIHITHTRTNTTHHIEI